MILRYTAGRKQEGVKTVEFECRWNIQRYNTEERAGRLFIDVAYLSGPNRTAWGSVALEIVVNVDL